MQKVSYMGNGSTTEFTFNFPYFENTDVVVTKNGATATGYNIVGNSAGLDADIPYTGGTVVFEVAPSALDNITIARSLPLQRQYDYQPTVKIDPTTLNQDMNYLMEVVKDLQDELDSLHAQYTDIADKESTETLLARISAVSGQIHDFETDIENGRIMSKDDFYSYTTNCITEIPQDIKLELNDGTLTLKAGSKVRIPNGSTFDIYTVQSDISTTPTGNSGTYGWFLIMQPNKTISRTVTLNNIYSGTTAPSGSQYMYWYDTTNNLVKYSGDSGSTWTGGYSLPIALISGASGVENINQVFNGFSYIGSTIFVFPGVSGLIPNGRNSDGTLKNTKYTVASVITYERNLTGTSIPLFIRGNGNLSASTGMSYDAANNIVGTGGYYQVGTVDMTAGVIGGLSVKYPIRIADNYDL